jgi:hypothetical protein
MDSVAERTTDRGITAALNYAAVMARPGIRLPQAMGSGPLAQYLFYQYGCTKKRADRPCCNGSREISAIQHRLGSITIKRSN